MDGYAVRAGDVAGASQDSPVTLPVDGEIAAGDTATTGQARPLPQIMTGALLPPGADAVVPVEWTDAGHRGDHGRSGADQPATRGVMRSATAATTLCQATCCCQQACRSARPRSACSRQPVTGDGAGAPPPRVAVISTGNELVEPGQPLLPGQIWESNSYMLAAGARKLGCDTTRHPRCGTTLTPCSTRSRGRRPMRIC